MRAQYSKLIWVATLSGQYCLDDWNLSAVHICTVMYPFVVSLYKLGLVVLYEPKDFSFVL